MTNKITHVALTILIVLLGIHIFMGQRQNQALSARIEALEKDVQPISLAVDCEQGEKLSAAIEQLPDNAVPVTIDINGICVEEVKLNRSHVTLRGNSAENDGIKTTSLGVSKNIEEEYPLWVGNGAQNVQLENLSFIGGNMALNCADGAHVTGKNLIVKDGRVGVAAVLSGTCILINPTIRDNIVGVVGGTGGFVNVVGGHVQNRLTGVMADRGGTVYLSANSASFPKLEGKAPVITGNMTAVKVGSNSIVTMRDADINNNTLGIDIDPTGVVATIGEVLVTDNETHGISVHGDGIITLVDKVKIANNGKDAIHCTENAIVRGLIPGDMNISDIVTGTVSTQCNVNTKLTQITITKKDVMQE